MGAPKNMIKGFIFMGIYIVITIVVPYLTFTFIRDLNIQGIPIILSQESYESIIYWLTAFGLIISGCAFFSFSSPKQSIRKGTFALIQVIINCLYLWSYRFSGATDIQIDISGAGINGYVILGVQQFILVFMGIYFLTISIKIYDLVDFTINREKIRKKRWGIE